MKHIKYGIGFLFGLLVAGCGQQGPLYLPGEKPPIYVPPEERIYVPPNKTQAQNQDQDQDQDQDQE